jgi:outer membrane protein assembly factor BamB
LAVWIGAGVSAAQTDVQSFTVTSRSGKNVLNWQNPDVAPYGATRIIGRTDRAPLDAEDVDGAILVVDVVGVLGGPGTVPHEGLLDGTTVFYGAFVSDGASSFSPGRFVEGTPFDTSGPVKWRLTPADSAVSMTPPGIGASILFPNNNGRIYSVERGSTGGSWPSTGLPASLGSPVQHRPPVISLAGVVTADRFTLVSSQDGFVRAVDADDGDVLWTSSDLGTLQAGPAAWLAGFGGLFDFVLVGTRNASQDNVLVALDAADGGEAWRFDDAAGTRLGIVNGGPSVDYSRSRVYFACHERSAGANTLYAMDLVTGDKVWSKALGDVTGSLSCGEKCSTSAPTTERSTPST